MNDKLIDLTRLELYPRVICNHSQDERYNFSFTKYRGFYFSSTKNM